MKLEKVQLASNPAMAQALSRTKPFSYQMILGFTSGFEFMGFFLGIAFLTMLASTLMFKVLSGAASDKMRYEMLYKIGTRRKVLKQSIRHEIGVLFLLPGILGVIDVLFGLRLFTALLHIHTWASGYHSQSSLFSTSSTMPLQLNCMKTLFCKNR